MKKIKHRTAASGRPGKDVEMLKKIIALTLTLVVLGLSLVSCKNRNGVPDGMQAAHLAGEPFCLYVPENWTVNTKSGISSAYSYANDKIIVSARYHAQADSAQTLDDYMIACAEGYAATMKDFYLVSRDPALLGGKDARKMEYTVTEAGKSYTCTQISTLHEGLVVSLSFYCLTDVKDAAAEEFEKIRAAFVLTSLPAPANDEVVDKKTPDGMKIASAKNDAHRLYVPKSWICHSESGKSEAYYPESGKPNVTVSIYVPDTSISIEDYFASCETRYTEALAGYERVATQERQVAARRAMSYTYRASYDGMSFRVMQTVLSDGMAIYSLTYTALDDRFDAHLTDVEAILGAFTFR